MAQNLNEIFNLFLVERKKDLASRTFSYYKEAIDLMRHCFNGYRYMDLDEEQSKKLEDESNKEIDFCDLFGSEVLDYSLFSEFLGYFLPRKVIVGKDREQKICGACLNFYKWLVVNNLIVDESITETLKDFRDVMEYELEMDKYISF